MAGLACILLCAAVGCVSHDYEAQAIPQPYEYSGKGVATLAAYEGYVMVQTKRWKPWRRITDAGVPLPEGVKVRTEDGNTKIRVPRIGTFALGPRTAIDLNRDRSMNILKRRRTEFPVFLERGRVVVENEPSPRGYLWICTELLAARLIEGAMEISGPEPMVAACSVGQVEIVLANDVEFLMGDDTRITVKPLSQKEVSVRADRGLVEIKLRRKQIVCVSASGFDDEGRVCPSEVDIIRD